MDNEKLKNRIIQIESRLKELVKEEREIEENLTVEDYDPWEQETREYFVGTLPKSIVKSKLQPMWDEAARLEKEIKIIEKMVEENPDI